MPLSKKGKRVMDSMKDQYGPDKAERVFYASVNAGRLKGVDPTFEKRMKRKKGSS